MPYTFLEGNFLKMEMRWTGECDGMRKNQPEQSWPDYDIGLGKKPELDSNVELGRRESSRMLKHFPGEKQIKSSLNFPRIRI